MDLICFLQVEQKEEKLRQTELSLGRKIEREFAEVIALCFKCSNFFAYQITAAKEELNARREEFMREKKVLAHLGFY